MKKLVFIFIGVCAGALAVSVPYFGRTDANLEKRVAQLELENLLLKKEVEFLYDKLKPMIDLQEKTNQLLKEADFTGGERGGK
ncbi:MAG: hypothetical protein N2053_05185 [Chitinispirillaceae bacterium]|nr:hypothetical protein [Chitinispirillaceae bacterium]